MVRVFKEIQRVFFYQGLLPIRLSVKSKIWMTVITIVLLFSFFVLFYLPAIQERYLLSNFNKEVQNHANTVALGVKIAMTEQNFEGVQTAMDFVKKDPQLRFVSLIQVDTVWQPKHTGYTLHKTIFKTYPEQKKIDVDAGSDDSTVVKRASFSTLLMKGEIVLGSSTEEIVQSKKQIRSTSLLFSFLVFAIGIVIGFGLAKNISVPVLELRDAATKVGLGDLTQRVVSKSRDEIGELGVAFNKMVTDLSTARRDVEDRTNELLIEKRKSDDLLDDLQKTLTDLKETQEQLIRQEKLASIGQLTKGLVDRILNPLNYINNFSALSKEFLLETKELLSVEKYASDKHLQDEVMPLLDMAETNTEKINEHGLNLSRIVRSMEKLLQAKSNNFIDTTINSFVDLQVARHIDETKEACAHFPVAIITELDSKNCSVKLLPTEMGMVINSLINNAVYSLREKSITDAIFTPTLIVRTVFSETFADIQIEDNGKGISAIEQKQLFSPFFTTKPTAKGTGLGLYISQDIIRTHKGTITVETQEGAYTIFTVRLPMATT